VLTRSLLIQRRKKKYFFADSFKNAERNRFFDRLRVERVENGGTLCVPDGRRFVDAVSVLRHVV
jgi:hypothetical protein